MRNAPRGDGWSRRQFILRGAATFGVAGFGLGGGLFARPRFDAYPFSLMREGKWGRWTAAE